jgi:hypothetical protein
MNSRTPRGAKSVPCVSIGPVIWVGGYGCCPKVLAEGVQVGVGLFVDSLGASRRLWQTEDVDENDRLIAVTPRGLDHRSNGSGEQLISAPSKTSRQSCAPPEREASMAGQSSHHLFDALWDERAALLESRGKLFTHRSRAEPFRGFRFDGDERRATSGHADRDQVVLSLAAERVERRTRLSDDIPCLKIAQLGASRERL